MSNPWSAEKGSMARLTSQEIDRTLQRIRAEYDHYIVHFERGPEAKNRFEDRYTHALKTRMDLTLFLGAEVQMVRALIDEAQRDTSVPPTRPRTVRRVSGSDQLIEQWRAKIRGYPDLGLPDHPEKSLDVDKLYGTLAWFRREIWDVLYPVLVSRMPGAALAVADTELGVLAPGEGRWPREVDAYWSLVVGNVDPSLVARAQNRCLLQGCQLLVRLRRLFDLVLEEGALSETERHDLSKARAFTDRVLTDFRLRELAARS